MIEYENLRKTVVMGLSKYIGCPVVRSNQNEAPPAYPYLSYTVTTLMKENKGSYGVYVDENGVQREKKPFTQIWSVTALAKNNSESVDIAVKAHEWLDYVGRMYLSDNNVIVQSIGGITNRDNFLTTEYEYRNGFDVSFWLENEVKNTFSEIIETADLKENDYNK